MAEKQESEKTLKFLKYFMFFISGFLIGIIFEWISILMIFSAYGI